MPLRPAAPSLSTVRPAPPAITSSSASSPPKTMSGGRNREYAKLSKALWKDLNPVGPVDEMLAVEIVRAAWRLHRCGIVEGEDGANPRSKPPSSAPAPRPTTPCGVCSTTCASFSSTASSAPKSCAPVSMRPTTASPTHTASFKALADNERFKSQSFISPIGFDPSTKHIRTQSAPVGQALSAGKPDQPSRDREGAVLPRAGQPPRAPAASAAATNRTVSSAPKSPGPSPPKIPSPATQGAPAIPALNISAAAVPRPCLV